MATDQKKAKAVIDGLSEEQPLIRIVYKPNVSYPYRIELLEDGTYNKKNLAQTLLGARFIAWKMTRRLRKEWRQKARYGNGMVVKEYRRSDFE